MFAKNHIVQLFRELKWVSDISIYVFNMKIFGVWAESHILDTHSHKVLRNWCRAVFFNLEKKCVKQHVLFFVVIHCE